MPTTPAIVTVTHCGSLMSHVNTFMVPLYRLTELCGIADRPRVNRTTYFSHEGSATPNVSITSPSGISVMRPAPRHIIHVVDANRPAVAAVKIDFGLLFSGR